MTDGFPTWALRGNAVRVGGATISGWLVLGTLVARTKKGPRVALACNPRTGVACRSRTGRPQSNWTNDGWLVGQRGGARGEVGRRRFAGGRRRRRHRRGRRHRGGCRVPLLGTSHSLQPQSQWQCGQTHSILHLRTHTSSVYGHLIKWCTSRYLQWQHSPQPLLQPQPQHSLRVAAEQAAVAGTAEARQADFLADALVAVLGDLLGRPILMADRNQALVAAALRAAAVAASRARGARPA